MSAPQIPPRPSRSQQSEPTTSAAPAPTVPPRPAGRRVDRPESPHYPQSPFNESPFHPHGAGDGASELHRLASLNASRTSIELPVRPPSVSLPSIGQEGIEYDASTPLPEEEAIGEVGDAPVGLPTHTRKVSQDLPLHAPRPSISSSDAKQRVAAVVRTDSNANAVSATSGSKTLAEKPLRAKPSFNRPPSAASQERPGSAYEDEYGIPTFGTQVPLGHQYGDVQAPSPAPGSQPNTPSTPAFERPPSARHHHRNKSGRNSFQAPPGSYGLHGHGNYENVDDFEKSWLKKHPDALRDEMSAHSPAILDRHDYTLTPDQLNKIVRGSKSSGLGAPVLVGMPDEQIGYMASEAYSSRNQTPRPVGSDSAHAALPASHVDSPVRNQVGAAGGVPPELRSGTVHVNEPEHKESKYTGRGQVSEQEHIDLGPRSGNTEAAGGWIQETGYGVPILASDEIDPTNEYLHPAVPPISENRRGSYIDGGSQPNSRPSSRPSSIHNVPVSHKVQGRGGEHHYLEDVREYEPLFPDEPETAQKAVSAADRFKQRPDMKQRFPSQDIWEDAPDSVNLSTEVETPEPERPAIARPAFETPEAEAARKGESSEAERAKLLPKEYRLAQSNFKPHLREEMQRPGLAQQRFPSRDIWEDSPDSAYITTTVGDEEEIREEEDEGLKAGAVVTTTSSLPREGATAGAPVVPPSINDKPLVPPRPVRGKSPDKQAPIVPDRPARRPSPGIDAGLNIEDPGLLQSKPAVPARPAKSLAYREQVARAEQAAAASAAVALDKAEPTEAASKPKPQVPARPVGSKIAALQSSFMSDLAKKIGAGPQVIPPKPDPTEEKAVEEAKPLEDARKGRARGPARRKPAASPSAAAASTAPKPEPRRFVASQVFNLFDISADSGLNSTHADGWFKKLSSSAEAKGTAPISREIPPAVGFNAQGEAVHAPSVTPAAISATSQVEGAPAMQAEAETSGEPADPGHAATTSTSVGVHSTAAGAKLAEASKVPAASADAKGSELERDPESYFQPAPAADVKQEVKAAVKPQPSTATTTGQEMKTGLTGEDDEDAAELAKTTSATQTGEMTIVVNKEGSNPIRLTAYKDGSAHEEGMAFVAWDDISK